MTNGDWKIQPGIWRRVKDISKEDIRVAIIGKIIDKAKDVLVLDDGTGKITVRFGSESRHFLDKVKTSDQVKVFGTVMPLEKEIELNGEMVQAFDVDIRLFNKVFDIIYK